MTASDGNIMLWHFLGIGSGVTIACIIALNFGTIEKSNDLRNQCEKDLARNLECEMRYVKPNNL